jgi:protein involved in polysaccharide export with SLBB domain
MQQEEPGAETSPQIPSDYLVKPGDELLVTIWGSVDADIRTRVDRNGRITIPRIGPVLVAGIRYSDLGTTISQRVGQVFRNFQISVALGQLRAQRVYVTGFVERPGAYSVSSLSTVLNALVQAGGPSAAGSLRQVDVMRGGTRAASLDLYEFLLRGNRSGDMVIQPDDVVHVGPLGTQVGLIGSVNRPGVYELKSGETVADLLRMAGGFTAVADRSRVSLERLDDRATVRITQLGLPGSDSQSLMQG